MLNSSVNIYDSPLNKKSKNLFSSYINLTSKCSGKFLFGSKSMQIKNNYNNNLNPNNHNRNNNQNIYVRALS